MGLLIERNMVVLGIYYCLIFLLLPFWLFERVGGVQSHHPSTPSYSMDEIFL